MTSEVKKHHLFLVSSEIPQHLWGLSEIAGRPEGKFKNKIKRHTSYTTQEPPVLLYTGVSKSKAVVEGDTMWKRGIADLAEQNHRLYSCQLRAAMMRVWCKEIL